ncbi:MAG TPA: FtsX-like permease family protein, partial [Verrucomicrobiae bacterium]|nr:FtsX-like permease family protein [Verrucomicrobiae bacterium]
MTLRTLLLRSLRFHARSHLGALLGAAVGSAVLIGALVVGDSVRGSLRDMALARLGRVQLALASNDRFFRAELAKGLEDSFDGAVVAALQLLATATTADDSARANRVQLLGVDDRFWDLDAKAAPFQSPGADEVILNERLAQQLGAKAGDTVLLRVSRPSALSRETPITPQEDSSVALRVTVRAIAGDSRLGWFGLQASQIPPFNAFVSLAWLQEKIQLPGRANMMLVSSSNNAVRTFDAASLRKAWNLEDAELELREIPGMNAVELHTSRVFLDPPVAEVALQAATNAGGVLTYFVNELRFGDRATPYSTVTAMGAPVVPAGMRDDEIIINQWLADDLSVKPEEELELKYFVMDLGRKLEERSAHFRVRSVVPLNGAAADRTLMPDFPGLDKAESTRDWDASLPVSLDKIRPKDEEYWKQYRGTPKAFVTLAAGRKLWSNRFGNLTAVRYSFSAYTFSRGMVSIPPMVLEPASDPNGATTKAVAPPAARPPGPTQSTAVTAALQKAKTEIEQHLLSRIDPASIGLRFDPVLQEALAAVDQSQDFGGLFIGFSFFLIVAALLLMALLFQFGIEQRAAEVGTLLAVGFTPRQVRRLLMFEGGALALVGGVIGLAGGLWYARAMLRGLSTVWRDAVGTSNLSFHAEPATLALGAFAAVVVAWTTVWLALRKQAKQPARELLAEGAVEEFKVQSPKSKAKSRNVAVAILCALGAIALIGWAVGTGNTANAGAFFGAGALLLIAGLAFASVYLSRLAAAAGSEVPRFSLSELGVRNCARRRTRSLSTLGLLACGSFLIASIGVFRLDAVKGAEKRSSGTGGFALIGESTLPVVHDLNTQKGREYFGIDDKVLDGVKVVPMRVRDGDDASCLNLNRAQKPRLLGVRPELLAEREAFTFAKTAKGLPKEKPWMLLKVPLTPSLSPSGGEGGPAVAGAGEGQPERPPDETIVPAIGDANSIQWAMGRKVGDTLDYTDDRGRAFKIRLVGAVANSILQGSLLIDEEEFLKRFPAEDGYRMFLIDAPSKDVPEVSATLTRALRDAGLELTLTAGRLAMFNAVQNTYLGTFQILGGLGLLLGSVGLGVVVLRNVLERRSELAVLMAVGFRRRALKWLVLSEHGALLVFGLGIGVLSALVAVLPAVLSPGSEVPYLSLALTLIGVLLSGALWTWLATMAALRGRLLDALRNE